MGKSNYQPIYYLSYFLTDNENKDKNKDKNKIKKYLIPLLTSIVENQNFDKDNTTLNKNFSIIIKNNYNKLPVEFKEKYIKLENHSPIKEQKALEEKINKSFNDAKIFLRDFRNIMMHKNVKEYTFSHCNFNNFDGELFSFLRIYLESKCEFNQNKKEILDKIKSDEKSYIKEVLKVSHNEMKENFKNVPFIYALMILAMFTESKYIKEILDLIKVKKFIKDIVSSFSLRGGYKTLVPGVVIEDDELYRKQLDILEQINKETYDTGKRIIKNLDYFNIVKENTSDNSQTTLYKNIIKLYGYGNSFPKIEELENSVREFKAKEIAESNISKKKGIEEYNENAREYNEKIDRGKPKLAIKNKNFETNYKNIIPTLNNVFRNEDVFMKEAMEFLLSEHKNPFGKDTWTISGNAIIWLEPNDNVKFDLRKKVKPSKNGMNSIYKIVYNKENANRFSLNRHNLRALLTSIIVNRGFNFKDLKNTATSNIKAKVGNNTNDLAKDLKNKIPNWNRFKQASLVVKTVRKSIIGDIHLHNIDSVSFYQGFMRILYRLDNRIGNIYDDAMEIINAYGIPDKNISEEIRKLLRHDNLEGMALSSADILVKLKNKKSQKTTFASFKTWSKYAFLPVNNKNEKNLFFIRLGKY